jgi:hypothetical protein
MRSVSFVHRYQRQVLLSIAPSMLLSLLIFQLMLNLDGILMQHRRCSQVGLVNAFATHATFVRTSSSSSSSSSSLDNKKNHVQFVVPIYSSPNKQNMVRHEQSTTDESNNNNNVDDSYYGIRHEHNSNSNSNNSNSNRRNMILQSASILSVGLVSTTITTINPSVANALVKGNVPPPKISTSGTASSSTDRPKCTNIDECQALAEIREQQIREQQQQADLDTSTYPILTTSSGTRYRDILVVNVDNDNDNTKKKNTVQDGDTVQLYYKVLKLGKRSYDGISGEGTVVFSCGYGYEDDERTARTKTFTTTIGSPYNIIALNDAIIGMTGIGSIRRIAIVPDKGWRKPGKLCDGGPGGSGTGGELRTDYVVVPTATIVETEKCFDQTKQPFPISFPQQRRMAQRFDQSLIMEIELVNIIR